MLDEAETPVIKPADLCFHMLKHAGDGRIQRRTAVPVFGQRFAGIGQQADPNTGNDAAGRHVSRQTTHVAVGGIAVYPGTLVGVGLPAAVNDHIGAVLQPIGHVSQQTDVFQDALARGVAIRVIPVVEAVNGFCGEQRIRAERAAEAGHSGKGIRVGGFFVHDFGHLKRARAEPDAARSGTDVQIQRNAFAIHLPDTHGVRTDFDAVAAEGAGVGVVSGKIPGEAPFGSNGAPLKCTVTAFPFIAIEQRAGGESAGEPQNHPGNRCSRCGKRNGCAVCGLLQGHGSVVKVSASVLKRSGGERIVFINQGAAGAAGKQFRKMYCHKNLLCKRTCRIVFEKKTAAYGRWLPIG